MNQEPSIDQLSFLAGSWAAPRGSGIAQETWMPPAGKTMLGVSRTIRDGATTFTEFMQISEVNGKLKMELQMKIGGPVIEFRVAVFPNRVLLTGVNDPNKGTVEYIRQGDKLNAIVKGERDGQPYKLEFAFEKVPSTSS